MEKYINPGRHIAGETKLSVVVPNTCGASKPTSCHAPGEYNFELAPMIFR